MEKIIAIAGLAVILAAVHLANPNGPQRAGLCGLGFERYCDDWVIEKRRLDQLEQQRQP